MPPKLNEEDVGERPRRSDAVTSSFFKNVLQKLTQASQQATQAMHDTLAAGSTWALGPGSGSLGSTSGGCSSGESSSSLKKSS